MLLAFVFNSDEGRLRRSTILPVLWYVNVQAALCVPAVSTAVAVIVFVPTGKFCSVCTPVVDGNVPKSTAPVVGFLAVYLTLTRAALVKLPRAGVL